MDSPTRLPLCSYNVDADFDQQVEEKMDNELNMVVDSMVYEDEDANELNMVNGNVDEIMDSSVYEDEEFLSKYHQRLVGVVKEPNDDTSRGVRTARSVKTLSLSAVQGLIFDVHCFVLYVFGCVQT